MRMVEKILQKNELENTLKNDPPSLRATAVLWMSTRLLGFAGLLGMLGLTCLEVALRAFGLPSGGTRSIRAAYDLDDVTMGPFQAGVRVKVTWPPETAYEASFNSLGCRGHEPLDLDKPTILCVGDSMTFGYSVEDDETWPAQLDQRLQAEGLARPVINLSSGHLLPEDELSYIKRAFDLIDDVGIVILLIPHGGYIDPIHLMSQTPHERSKRRERERRTWPNSFFHNLAVYETRFFFRLWRQRLFTEGRQKAPPDFQAPDMGDIETRRLLQERYKKKIAEIKEVVEEKGALFVLAAFPGARVLEDEVVFGEPWSASIASELGCLNVDIRKAFLEEEDKKSLLLIPHDLHASPRGNKVVADTVFTFLRKGGYLK